MPNNHHNGRHFLQVPGPTNVPERVLRAIARPTIDHRGPTFRTMVFEILEKLQIVFQTASPVFVFPSSGTGAWEAALVNTLSPGDRVIIFEAGYFASQWQEMAKRLGLDVVAIVGDWHSGVDPSLIQDVLENDHQHKIRAVCVVHNETSTGITSAIPPIRQALDDSKHPALLLVDTVSSLGSINYQHEEWNVDVTICCSQKGLMLPPGLGFNAVSRKALSVSQSCRMPRSYWDWENMLHFNKDGIFPYTPGTNLLFGLNEALTMILDEGLDAVIARHTRYGTATRLAIDSWGLTLVGRETSQHSNSLTAVNMPTGYDADQFRKIVLDTFNLSLGGGLGKLSGIVFRIGHLGDFNDLMLIGTLGGVELGLGRMGVPHNPSGVQAALNYLSKVDLQ